MFANDAKITLLSGNVNGRDAHKSVVTSFKKTIIFSTKTEVTVYLVVSHYVIFSRFVCFRKCIFHFTLSFSRFLRIEVACQKIVKRLFSFFF